MNNFPIHCYPPKMRAILEGLPSVVGSRSEFGGLAALFLGSIVAAKVKVNVKKGWDIETNLYTAIVAKKGEAKTPAIKFICGPMFKYFSNETAEYFAEMEKWEKRVEKARAKRNKSGQADLEALELDKPKFPWFGIVTSGTVEGLRDVALQHHKEGHPSRIGRYNDELNGWIQSMNQYSEGGDVEYYLQAHDGDIHIKANKGEKTSAPPTTLSITGSIQPEIFADSFSDQNTSNGLLDRIMISTPSGEKPEADPFFEWDGDVLDVYSSYVNKLLDGMEDRVLTLSDSCRDIAREFHEHIRKVDERCGAGASPKWWQHYFKVVGIMTVLWEEKNVTVETCKRSSEICRYFVGCWVRAFKEMSKSDTCMFEGRIIEHLKKNAGEMSEGDLKKQFNSQKKKIVDDAINNLDAEGEITISLSKAGNGREIRIIRLSLSGGEL